MQETHDNSLTANLVKDLLKEKRADRRWKMIRFVFWFALIAFTIYGISTRRSSLLSSADSSHYIALIRLNGMIAPDRDFSSETLIPILKDAFSDKKALGVIIDINSPGGTPVQAAIIHDAIVIFKNKYHKKVIIVGEDMLTSGAYYVAVAGDKIYVNSSTLTGSIGVIMKGFGFVDTLKKLGIERRVYTSGNNKDRLDPFLPQNPEDIAKIQMVMEEVHKSFIRAVLEGRKDKLVGDPATIFTGDFWSGETALKMGLVDGVGNLMDTMQKEFNTTDYTEYGSSRSFFRMLGGGLGSTLDSIGYS